jgi:hypothetical protein
VENRTIHNPDQRQCKGCGVESIWREDSVTLSSATAVWPSRSGSGPSGHPGLSPSSPVQFAGLKRLVLYVLATLF